MSNAQLLQLIPIIPPIIAGIVGLISSRSGIPGKIKEIDYHLKRLELINQLSDYLDKHKISGGNQHYLESINREISVILTFIQKTKEEETEVKVLTEKQKSSRFLRLFILPKPITTGGWVATIIYYLYGFVTLFYLIVLFYPSLMIMSGGEEEILAGGKVSILAGIIGSFIFTLFGRYFALRSWRKKIKKLKEKKNNA